LPNLNLFVNFASLTQAPFISKFSRRETGSPLI
jgi:hypothetical protein